MSDAMSLQEAGASLLFLGAIPNGAKQEVTEIVSIPTIGIGARLECSVQVMVIG